MSRATEFIQNDRYADAESEYRAALRLDPQNADLHFGVGCALSSEGDVDGEIEQYREALRLDLNNVNAHIDLGEALGHKKGDWGGAVTELREAVRLDRNNDWAQIDLGAELGRNSYFHAAGLH